MENGTQYTPRIAGLKSAISDWNPRSKIAHNTDRAVLCLPLAYHSATLIDNIFFNSLENHAISGNILCGITDHLPNFLIITKLSNPPKNFTMYKRDYSRLDNEALISEVSKVNWSEVLINESEVFADR